MLEELLNKYKFNLNSSQINKFGEFLDLFLNKNSQINLSAIRDEKDVLEKHFIDSIMLDKFLKLNWKILDIGTGWGFPGIPLAITNENVNFTLLDSTKKKIDAVNDFVEKLNLNNCKWVWWRAEELDKLSEYKNKFDFVVSRATAYLPQILIWSMNFLKNDWKMIFYKLYNQNEINDGKIIMKKLGFQIEKIEKYIIDWQERVLIFVERI